MKDDMAKVPKGWDIYVGRRKRPVRKGVAGSPPGKKRLLIAKKTESEIREMIEEWPGPKLQWGPLMAAINARFGGSWTRQAVSRHPKLQKAWDIRRKELAKAKVTATGKTRPEGDGTAEVLKRQVRNLREENEELKKLIGRFEEKFVRWTTNASMQGWSIKKLDAALNKIDRGQSDKDR